MSDNNLSSKYKKLFRIIGILGIILLLFSCTHKLFIIFKYGFSEDNPKIELYKSIFLNFICTILFFLIILKPERLEFFSLMSFVYMIEILIADSQNLIPMFMLMLCIITLNIRGFFTKKKSLKISFLVLSYIIALTTQIRFGLNIFILSLLSHLAAIFITGICAILIQKQFSTLKNRAIPSILDLTQYEELSDQDKTIIRYLKEGQKYDWIAGALGIATPTVKKHIKRIFKILGVIDLIDFHAKFSNSSIIYTKEELLEWKKAFLEKEF